jgi:hypothetical protein
MIISNKIKAIVKDIRDIKSQQENIKLMLGAVLTNLKASAKTIAEAEFKVFSQFGDDGIIQYLIKEVQPSSDKFIEFGVENYEESNTRFLLINNNWKGLVIDGAENNISYIRNDSIYWRYGLTAVCSFITAENINDIFSQNDYKGNIGLLHIDIDGNDYWVWKAITEVDPDIVIVEYNSLFGSDRAITVPYKPDFTRSSAHYSYLYAGVSLPALCLLAEGKGYAHVGCNSAGNNAYFVKKKKLGSLTALSASEGYVQAKFRESRSTDGSLSFADLNEQRKLISGLPVFNVITQKIEPF